MLITGPNAGGKSTLAKAICINVYLSQCIGIATCDKIYLNLYDKIYTHFRIKDEEGSKSLFQEEISRCNFLYSNLNYGNCLAIFDELFCSTSYLEGMSCAYSLCHQLGKLSNFNLIVTTHYDIT